MVETDNCWLPPLDSYNIEASREAMRKHVAELRAKGHDVYYEVWNESFEGQAAINIMNGLPPDADPSEVEGCFDDWLQPLFPGNVG